MALKKVIYLFGSGASHAVVNAVDSSKQLLTADIRQKIHEKESEIAPSIPIDIWNELMDPKVDIEHLISILESNYNYDSTQLIKRYYHDAIMLLSKEFIDNIDNGINTPNLYSILFDLHSIRNIGEKVIGVFTLNYEDIFERTLKSHLKIDSDYIIGKNGKNNKNIPVIKLHGSFNWKNTRPININLETSVNTSNALWIPPGVEKKKDNYPFNILWGKAFELLLKCDTLRVIGCSLSRNDWGLIPMIYTAMRLSKKHKAFDIEIIDFYDKGQRIKVDYPYLDIKSIIEIIEFRNYLIDRYDLKTSNIPKYVKDILSSDASKKLNIFEIWLKSKRFDLQNAKKNIRTRKRYFENFS